MRLATRARYGSIRLPVRSEGNMLLNSPDGWVSSQAPYWFLSPSDPNFYSDSHMTELTSAIERARAQVIGPLVTVLPWRTVNAKGVEVPLPGWLNDPMMLDLVTGPNAPVFPLHSRKGFARFWSDVLTYSLFFGKGFFVFAETSQAQPIPGTMRVLSNAMIDENSETGNWVIGDNNESVETDSEGRFTLGGNPWRIAAILEPFGPYGGQGGNGVIGRHAKTLGLAIQVRRYASGTFASGIPNGYLKVTQPIAKEQADKLKADWLEAHGGDKRSIAVLSSMVDFTPISISPVDAAVAEVDRMVLKGIAHAFNLGGWALDAGSDSNTYANIQDRRQEKLDETLMPWKRTLEDTLTGLLPYGTRLVLETTGYLRTDEARRTAYYEKGLNGGWLTIEEVREMERLG